MKVGFPNNPRKVIKDEIKWIADNGFDFIDLFLEPDKSELGKFNVREIKSQLDFYGLERVGHAAWYLPIGSSFSELRTCAVEIVNRYLDVFANVGCDFVTIHSNWPTSLFSEDEGVKFQTESIQSILSYASKAGVKIMLEPLGTIHDHAGNIDRILALNDQLYFHADIGHLNLYGRDPVEYLLRYKDKLMHIHLHDNNSIDDLHLPIGTGNIDWDNLINVLKSFYDGTVTLEIFSEDKDYVLYSKKKLLEKWQGNHDNR
ncbi:sugar phosphate isomerase/epimerase family protein [Dethiobacter alkaliphilus]|uniref:Xylose isomerase domain protein TIM barrel n=1 Tax=Dethiobacter alkaliphilus AHT 1 TaxID=555088 RepID=C0GFP7_DETAL|nr:sugar phosphate isomerase/epimerase family protein [Dethiobacter alkaliphilus]EEG78007.1 Xylose isomerase domain protein TIM barrel [Dethiobacter alkaliphilus AHT 1]